MSRKYKFRNPEGVYFISFATVYWIDLLIRPDYNEIILDSIGYCQKEKDLEVYGWCFMTSHIHMIIGSKEFKLEDIVRDLKRHTSKMLKENISSNNKESRKEWMLWMMERAGKKNGNNANWQLWQQQNHPVELVSNEMITQKLDYVHDNPVAAGFVNEPEHWRYSSAIDYAGGKGLLEIKYAV